MQKVFVKVIDLRTLVGLARAIQRQISNTGTVGAIDVHLRKLMPSSVVCLVRHQTG